MVGQRATSPPPQNPSNPIAIISAASTASAATCNTYTTPTTDPLPSQYHFHDKISRILKRFDTSPTRKLRTLMHTYILKDDVLKIIYVTYQIVCSTAFTLVS